MARFRYRAVMSDGTITAGIFDAVDHAQALSGLRSSGVRPLEVSISNKEALEKSVKRANTTQRKAVTSLMSELSVLLNAGLSLDRALTLAIANAEDPVTVRGFDRIAEAVREGQPLSKAMRLNPGFFSPTAVAMAEAGEANGRLGPALARLAATSEQSEELRGLIVTSMIYPIALLIIAVSVILMMLLFVVPQFESLFDSSRGKLPEASRMVMAASKGLRHYWKQGLSISLPLIVVIVQFLRRPSMRARVDSMLLAVPQIGTLIRYVDTARFARTLGVLLEGEVPLPYALGLATRTINNATIRTAMTKVAEGVKEGSGLTAPISAARILPQMAIGFLRTGEETSQLGPMLGRLADVLDKSVKVRLQRLVGVLTPIITVTLGAAVAGVVASIMSAIMGFNDLAVSP